MNGAESVPESLRPLLPELAQALTQQIDTALAALTAGDMQAFQTGLHAAKGMAMTFRLDGIAREAHAATALARQPHLAAAALAGLRAQALALHEAEQAVENPRMRRC